ncbi:hypothetical protein GCM10011588_26060 [Nocardia jinanensis]|uniref:Uncharacterized protein n=1 Tax=Nocardia jinanensis TaxID=382504 RepID=A0A917VRF6_9NOCA|nr:hypothetical protein GCM10011588_26060 [Nocardia jinanensis]
MESIASCTRGSATVTNVRLVENGAKWELLFDWNGTTESWPVYPGGEREEMEASLIFATYLHTLGRGSVERLCPVYPRGDDWAGEAVFGNPETLDRLGKDFELTFTSPFR